MSRAVSLNWNDILREKPVQNTVQIKGSQVFLQNFVGNTSKTTKQVIKIKINEHFNIPALQGTIYASANFIQIIWINSNSQCTFTFWQMPPPLQLTTLTSWLKFQQTSILILTKYSDCLLDTQKKRGIFLTINCNYTIWPKSSSLTPEPLTIGPQISQF